MNRKSHGICHRGLVCLSVVMLLGVAAAPLSGALTEQGSKAPEVPRVVESLEDEGVQSDASTPGEKIRQEVSRLAEIFGIPLEPLPPRPCPGLASALSTHFAYMDAQMPPRLSHQGPPSLGDREFEDQVACLLDALMQVNEARDQAYAGVDWQALQPLWLEPSMTQMDEAPALDLEPMVAAALRLAERLDALLEFIENGLASPVEPARWSDGTLTQPQSMGNAAGDRAPPEVDLEPVLAIDRLGDTFYEHDYALVIDTKGDDLYDNNAGGGMIAFGGGPFIPPTGNESTWQHTVAPLGSGAPHVVVGGDFEDAEAILSAALAVDTHGDDTFGVYRAADPERDGRCTHEPIVRRVVVQGAAVGGVAMLVATEGDNQLHARVIGQGTGHVGGIGVLYLGGGNDTLQAVRSAQGSGVFGGFGVLINEGGRNVYKAEVPDGGTHNADLGICDEVARYVQGSGFGRSVGGGVGVAGVLRDEGGDSYYVSDIKSQGFGGVLGAGLLFDVGGDDQFEAKGRSMGYGEGHASTGGAGLGVLFNRGGDDVYRLDRSPGLGMGAGWFGDPQEVPDPYLPPTLWVNDVLRIMVNPLLKSGGGLFVDDGGSDLYSIEDREDDHVVVASDLFGVFVDGEYAP